MQKEKKVRTYQRRTKSGKMVTVRAHTAKYDAAEEAKELAKKKGSGDELELRKRKLAMEQLAGKKAADILEEKLKGEDFDFDATYEDYNGDKVSPISKPTSNWKSLTKHDPSGWLSSKEISRMKKDGELEDDAKFIAVKHKDGTSAVYVYGEGGVSKVTKKKTKEKLRPVGDGTNGPVPKKEAKSTSAKSSAKSSEPAFTAAEYKQWYHWDQDSDPNNKAAKKVAKALRAQMGRAGYNKYFNEMTEGYSPRGHISAYKKVGSWGSETASTKKTSEPKKGIFRVRNSKGKEITGTRSAYLEQQFELKTKGPKILRELESKNVSQGLTPIEFRTLKELRKKHPDVAKREASRREKESALSKTTKSKVSAPKDPFERAELIRALKSGGKGNFNRAKMQKEYSHFFAKGSWNPSAAGKRLLAED